MPREILTSHIGRINKLAAEINQFVPIETKGVTEFRADLAGLFVVAVAASYESCVKDTLTNFAASHHPAFGAFTEKNYDRLNSRISREDLFRYTKLFDTAVSKRYKELLAQRRVRITKIVGRDIEVSYKQILDWRHDFAHAGKRNTTIEEAIITHRLAKHVIFAFGDAFHELVN